jgi:outer membrane protein OmpA-like peptidoglycan-associated protein/tetratricopeptide (TPR) repeat protein
MKTFFLLITTVFFAACSVAQPGSMQWSTKSKKAIKYAEYSRTALSEINPQTGLPNYENAMAWCDKAIAKDPNFIEAYMLKADYATSANLLPEAIAAYRKTLEINPNFTRTGFVYLELANLEWANADYAEAIVHAKQYKKIPGANRELFGEVDWLIANCEFAVTAIKNPVPFKPKNLGTGVNTHNPEYFPTLTVDQKELLFTRLVGGGRSGQEDFFVSKSDGPYWRIGEPMPPNINTAFNEGAPTFAPDGRTLIFVGCQNERGQYGENRRGYGSCDLFVTAKVGQVWLDPINLPGAVNTANWETQPSLSADGKTLYFIRGSVRSTGGKGKRNGDIYVSYLQADGSWSEAEKLPNHINTPLSESSVLIHPDGKTLYFGSNGHIGMGGYDLYMTRKQADGSWGPVKNLGYPINTENDESSLLVFADGKLAIFASDRPGGHGSLDLYGFELPESVRPNRTIYMTGLVYNKTTKQKLQANFSLFDLETKKEVVFSQSDGKTGEFLVTLPVNREYALLVEKKGYQPYSINFDLNITENANEPYHQNVPLIPLENMDEEVVLQNVFFDVDSYTIREKSFVELDKLAEHLKRNPTMKIELQGHTDAQGDADQNMILSTNRAKAVMDYLVKQGVESFRLTSKGFGETKPATIVDNSGTEVTLTESYISTLPVNEQKAANQANRRTVYIVKSL